MDHELNNELGIIQDEWNQKLLLLEVCRGYAECRDIDKEALSFAIYDVQNQLRELFDRFSILIERKGYNH